MEQIVVGWCHIAAREKLCLDRSHIRIHVGRNLLGQIIDIIQIAGCHIRCIRPVRRNEIRYFVGLFCHIVHTHFIEKIVVLKTDAHDAIRIFFVFDLSVRRKLIQCLISRVS